MTNQEKINNLISKLHDYYSNNHLEESHIRDNQLFMKFSTIAEDKKNNYKFSRDYVSPCGFISVSEFAHIIEETFEKFINSKEYKLLFGKKNKK